MTSINEILQKGGTGLHYDNRLILPFKAHFLKVIINDNIITDFSPSSKGIFIREEEDFTDVYFYDYANLKEECSKYESIKIIIVEKGQNIFDFNNHIKLAVYLKENHKAEIEKTDADILFIE